ncbi:MAG: hypothetical protein ACJA0M_000895, partial [Chitinophagales bacterium]
MKASCLMLVDTMAADTHSMPKFQLNLFSDLICLFLKNI